MSGSSGRWNVMHKWFIAGICLLAGSVRLYAGAVPLDALAATVNNEAISCYQLQQGMQTMQAQLAQSGQGRIDKQQLYQRVLDTEIMLILQKREAKKLGISVPDEEVDQAIERVAQSNGLLVSQLKAILKKQGMDFERYRQNIHDRLLVNKLIDQSVRSQINISDEAMREYYRKYLKNPKPIRELHIRQILLALPASPTPEEVRKVRDQALDVYDRLHNGESFDRLAALYSASGSNADNDLGWFMQGSISPVFSAVFALPVGQVTEPTRSPAGFHILQAAEERWKKPDVGEAYDEVHARHILLKIPASASETEQAEIMLQAKKLAQQLKHKSSEDFAARAREVSQGPSASKGGDLGWFKRGMMVKPFEDAVFSMKPGTVSDVVRTQFGLHIIRLEEKRHIDPGSYEANRDRIRQLLTEAEMQTQVPRWMAHLKSQAVIKQLTCPQGMME